MLFTVVVWRVLLDPVTEPGPFTVVAILEGFDDYTIQLQDVLFGDVWLCAGEDNMQFSVRQVWYLIHWYE